MLNEKEEITVELRLRRRSLVNKLVLGSFLVVAVITLLMRIITGALLDAGLVDGHFHIGFWKNPQGAFSQEFNEWLRTHQNSTWEAFLKDREDINKLILHHPNSFWFLTQFTWLTTIIVIFYLVFRFFRYDDTIPRWLRWITKQRTLSLVAMYDLIVGVIFWSVMYKVFLNGWSSSLMGVETAITILVHTVIPILVFTYALIFLIKDKRASLLSESFALKGLFFPVIYACYYTIVTIVWNDPYAVSNMHQKLTSGTDINGQEILLREPNWGGWSSELWKLPLALGVIYIILGVSTILHNVILIKFNKLYNPKYDYERGKLKNEKLERVKRSLIRKEARHWRNNK